MRSPQALENVVRHVKPGGRVATAGAKLAPWWALPVNAVIGYQARKYITTFEGIRRPWTHLASLVPDLQIESMLWVEPMLLGGRCPPRAPPNGSIQRLATTRALHATIE